jgi:hypothetical protein
MFDDVYGEALDLDAELAAGGTAATQFTELVA